MRQAIFGNIGTMVTFRLGVDDSYILAKEMGVFTAEELLSLELGQAIVRAGGSSTVFNLTTTSRLPRMMPFQFVCTVETPLLSGLRCRYYRLLCRY